MKIKQAHKEKLLKYYLHKFTHIRINTSKKNGISPHKPVLLLSVISNIETGKINSNKIFISPELVATFKDLWIDLVENEKHHCIFTMPFYHLSSSSFWKLIAKKGYEKIIQSKIAMKSFSNLNEAVEYAEIDNELFIFLKNKEERDILKYAILEKYFPNIESSFSGGNNNYFQNIENQILNEPSIKYKTNLQHLQNKLNADGFEEEKYMRSSIFKRQIPILYRNTCAISGLQINATINVSLIDACHIIPFSNSYDDTISNGISLTPTLHRAFDRGLISIDDNYKIIISNKFKEEKQSRYSIIQFKNKEIFLPENSKFYPNLENLKWHRENIFK